MKILVVSHRVPYEGVLHAGGVFLLRHLERMARDAEVTLLVPDGGVAREAASRAPSSFGVVVADPPEPGRALETASDWLRQRARTAALTPAAIQSLRQAGLRQLAEAADVVEVHWPECMILTRELRRSGVTTPLAVVPHDINAEATQSRLRGRPLMRRVAGRLTLPARRRTDMRDLAAADLVQVFKDDDRSLLRAAGVSGEIAVIDPWFAEPVVSRAPHTDPTVLFTGAMWRPENADGARWLLAHVWPRVRAAVPTARLVIAGADPSEALREAATHVEGVELTGTVDDLDAEYARADVFVAPLFVAGGLKFKVPQAMLFELPVVATSVAAVGIGAPFWSVTDEATVMSEAIVRALTHPDEAAAIGREAAAWCRERFSFERSSEAVLARYRKLVALSP